MIVYFMKAMSFSNLFNSFFFGLKYHYSLGSYSCSHFPYNFQTVFRIISLTTFSFFIILFTFCHWQSNLSWTLIFIWMGIFVLEKKHHRWCSNDRTMNTDTHILALSNLFHCLDLRLDIDVMDQFSFSRLHFPFSTEAYL